MLTVDGVRYYGEKEISTRFGLSVSYFRKARYSGDCPVYHKLRGMIFYTEENVTKWFRENLIPVKEGLGLIKGRGKLSPDF